jgi:hypothetical protein
MKKLFTITLTVIIVGKTLSQNSSDSIKENKIYIDLFCNYGFLPVGGQAIGYKNTSSGVENVYGSYGQGLSYGSNIGYMFNNHISGELGFSILSGKVYKANYNEQYFSSENKFNGKMSRLELGLKITTGKTFKPFLKFGIIYGIKTEINGEIVHSITMSSVDYTTKEKYSGGFCFGHKVSLGSDYNISKLITLFLDIQMITITWAPEKLESTLTINYNGTNSTIQSTTIFVDKLTGQSSTDLKHYYPFGSFGITTGIKFKFLRTK